ncbi:unnamed protein product [Mytilus edulis]|uniref:Uncharacterized protein n=1 Tax=Mytilus edulis TaxID=6550 RepID=A0A8S3U755_MYTED|nr:unnamed protein product [Mytilus edulis]
MRLGGGGQHSAQMLCTEVLPPGVQPHHLKQTAPVMEPQSQPPIVMKDTTNSISQQQPIVITPHVSAPQPLSNRSAQQTVRSGGYSGMPPTSYQNTMTMHPVPKKRPPSAPGITAPQPFTQKRERKILYIVDPNTGKDIISDVMSTRSTPPASTGSGSRGRTLMRLLRTVFNIFPTFLGKGTSPPQGKLVLFVLSLQLMVDATMRSGGGEESRPALKPSTEVLPPGVQPHHLKQTAPVMEPPISTSDCYERHHKQHITTTTNCNYTTCLSSPTTEQ